MLTTTLFDNHDLATQDRAALMQRVDTKYLVPVAQLNQILPALQNDYTALEIGGQRQMHYESLYFDTPERAFYHAHHNGKLNRFKVRLRRYLDTREQFAEVKCRTNKGQTVKQRVALAHPQQGLEAVPDFLGALIGPSFQVLRPELYVRYQRLTLLDHRQSERSTIDTALEFERSETGIIQKLPELAVVEVKTRPDQKYALIREVMKAHRIHPIRFSKYCIGLAANPELAIKRNRFKRVLQKVDALRAAATNCSGTGIWCRQDPTILISHPFPHPHTGAC
jgi:hypothetical protein